MCSWRPPKRSQDRRAACPKPLFWRTKHAQNARAKFVPDTIERGGQVVIHLLANVQQKTIKPFMKDTMEAGTLVYPDAYSMYARLETWGYGHKSVNHGRGEYARDEDGDGFCEVHVNTMEGFWSLLRSWRRPHRGISQEKLPLYLGFFECVHNVRRRGKALLPALIELLVT